MASKTPTETIFGLLNDGQALATAADAEDDAHKSEALARRAIGYFNAAATLLSAFADLHSDLIEHPLFMNARKFSRKYRF